MTEPGNRAQDGTGASVPRLEAPQPFPGEISDSVHEALAQSDRARQASEQRLQEVLLAGNMGLWEWDLITNTVHLSEGAERLYGLQAGSFEGTYRAYQRFLHPEDSEAVGELLAQSLYGRSAFNCEHRVLLQDDAVRWIESKGHAFYDEQGRPLRMSGTVADITDRKRLEQEVLRFQKMGSIDRLAGGVVHDFNNLLCAIMLFAELAEAELPEEGKLKTFVGHMRDAATRANDLTLHLLTFARKEMSASKVIRLNALIEEISHILRPLIGETNALTLLLKEDVGNIKFDPTQLEQLIVNLVGHACASLVGGKITIRTDNATLIDPWIPEGIVVVPGEYVLIVISDTGTVLSEEAKRHIVDPLFHTKAGGPDAGLGQADVYEILKQYHGYIFFDSDPGAGTTARVYVPRVLDAPRATGLGAASGGDLRGTATILVVEDEQLVREALATILRENGYTVLEARNGTEALQAASAHIGELDLLVTDVVMPELGGRELVDRLRTDRPGIRIMYLSGYTEETTLIRDLVSEGAAFLQKPFQIGQLLAVVHAVLEGDPAA